MPTSSEQDPATLSDLEPRDKPDWPLLLGGSVVTCVVCGHDHKPTPNCLRCKAPLQPKECIICTNCDLMVMRRQKEYTASQKAKEFLERMGDGGACLPADTISGKRTLDTFKRDTPMRKDAWNAIRDFLMRLPEQSTTWLYISGPSGSGKSHLAAGALREWMTEHHGGLYIKAFDFIIQLRSNQDESAAILRRVSQIPFLVLDDLGTENVSEYTTNIWHLIFSARGTDGSNRPTIITSNYSVPELAARWATDDDAKRSPRVIRRISDSARWIELPEPYNR